MTEKPNAFFGGRSPLISLTELLCIALLGMSTALPAQGYHQGFDDLGKANGVLHGVLALDQTGEWTAQIDGEKVGRYGISIHQGKGVGLIAAGAGRFEYDKFGLPNAEAAATSTPPLAARSGGSESLPQPPDAGYEGRFEGDQIRVTLRLVGDRYAGSMSLGQELCLLSGEYQMGVEAPAVFAQPLIGIARCGQDRFRFEARINDANTLEFTLDGLAYLLKREYAAPTGPVGPSARPPATASRPLRPEPRRPSPRLPAGFHPVGHNAAGGQLLVDQGASRGRSARRLIGRAFDRFAGYFDQRPTPISAFGDRRDSEAQVMFRASLDGVPIQGLAVAAVGADTTLTALAFDELDRAVQTVSEMMPTLGRLLPQSRSVRAPAVRWRQVPIPDGSGSLDLPMGWNIVAAINSMIDIAGPDGSYINLGINVPVLTPESAMTFWQMPGASQSMLVTARYSDPVTALREIFPQVNRQNPRYVTRIIEHAPVPWQNGQAAFIHFESQSPEGGTPQESLTLVIMMPGYGQWTYYFSMVSTPTGLFDQNLPTMVRIWHSWKVSDHVFRERMRGAMDSMREISRIIDQSHADRQASFDRTTADWTEVFRDQTQVRDTRIGDYHEVPLPQLDDVVRGMNEAAGYERYEHLPLRDLQ